MRSVLAAERDTDGVVGKPELETILLSFSQDCLGIAGALPVWSLIGIEAVALGRIWMMFHETFGFWSMGFLDYVSVGKDSEPHESESAPLLSTGFCRFRIWQLSGKVAANIPETLSKRKLFKVVGFVPYSSTVVQMYYSNVPLASAKARICGSERRLQGLFLLVARGLCTIGRGVPRGKVCMREAARPNCHTLALSDSAAGKRESRFHARCRASLLLVHARDFGLLELVFCLCRLVS